MDPSDSFKNYLTARITELNIGAVYNETLRSGVYSKELVAEAVQICIFFLEVNAVLFGPATGHEISCLSQYLTVLRDEHPTRKTKITGVEILYLIAKVDSIMNKSIPISGSSLLPSPPSNGTSSPNIPMSSMMMYT